MYTIHATRSTAIGSIEYELRQIKSIDLVIMLKDDLCRGFNDVSVTDEETGEVLFSLYSTSGFDSTYQEPWSAMWDADNTRQRFAEKESAEEV